MNLQERVNCASLAAILAALLLFGWHQLHQPSTSPAAAPAATAQQQLPAVLTVKPAVTVSSAEKWANATLAGAGITLPDNVTMLFTSVANCGAEASATGLGGCTYTLTDSRVIVISPELAWTQDGSHILFHEVGHALGIADECGAEEFAHQFEDPANLVWSYPTCNA